MRTDELTTWLTERLGALPARHDTRAYVVSVFDAMRTSGTRDLSTESLVLAFFAARETGDFAQFQRVGDWCLWVGSFAPTAVESLDLTFDIGSQAYATCDRLMRGSWPLFNELAVTLPNVTAFVRTAIFGQSKEARSSVAGHR